ncbi:hypothetical protein JXB22_03070 [candidate division WOR-3 bacterium]|nr:hypothetical protein [candidate division WOR-3 bacterium]
MSKVTSALIPLILIVLLSVFFYLSPRFIAQPATSDGKALEQVITKRFMNVGNLIAHATFVEDAIITGQSLNLSEIIARFKRDEKEITYIHFTNAEGEVLASNEQDMVGKAYQSELLESGNSVVRVTNGLYEGAFKISVGKTVVGVLYFGARPDVPFLNVSPSSSPIPLVVGIIVGIIAFVIILAMQRNLESKIVDDINKRQEEVFSPKIESLRRDQEKAKKDFEQLQHNITASQEKLETLNQEHAARKQEIESNPVVQSIEKLKASEAEVLKRLEKLKGEEQQFSKEITLLNQKREEVRSALEAEKKEEHTLHEKLDLIKKKILHLETPKK